jgi:hypothetical protein
MVYRIGGGRAASRARGSEKKFRSLKKHADGHEAQEVIGSMIVPLG